MKPVRPDLIVKGNSLDFSHVPQVDAEGQVARKRIYTEAPAGPQGGVPGQHGQLPAVIEYTGMAGELANAVKTACAGCANHDVKAWRQFVAAATGPASSAEDRQTIQTLRGRLLMEGRGIFDANDELDVEATLNSLGICRVLSDWVEGAMGLRHPAHWPVVTEREATCPTYVAVPGARMEVTTPAQPLGLFKARDGDARKIGDMRRDAVLWDAAGKVR